LLNTWRDETAYFSSSTQITYSPTGNSAGPNLLETPQMLTSANPAGANLKSTGMLDATLANTRFRIEFFASVPGAGQFGKFLGFVTVKTDSNGNVEGGFSATFKNSGVLPGATVSATATDPAGNTSGLATPVRVLFQA
jgi:hypothetical protein